MKKSLKIALVASAAAFVLGTAVPSQAQQDNMRAAGAKSQQRTYQTQSVREVDTTEGGYEAYAYAPGGATYGAGGCATEGSYGQGLDHSACGGGGGD